MVNSRFCEILGRHETEVRECRVWDFTHPDDADWTKSLYERARMAGEAYQIEKRYLRPDGTCVWCEVSVSFVKDADGGVETSIAVAQDITTRKKAEAALAEQSSLLQNVVDSVADLIFVKDLEGNFILANRALIEGCGDIVGWKTTDLFDADLTPTYEEADRDVIRTGRSLMVDEWIPIGGNPDCSKRRRSLGSATAKSTASSASRATLRTKKPLSRPFVIANCYTEVFWKRALTASRSSVWMAASS
ncbi:PAS domain S-box protein (plasmid) [Sphingomonas daechungensis]|uniref:histidine kinase n=1 Tax=Sphingomonas daechungensis TaxID=1176646 RepID=A0ABX6T3U7_9SPHN|nr:PAS domain S-box protein [Sphingomonas daechungensis]